MDSRTISSVAAALASAASRVRLPTGFAARLAIATSALVVVACAAQSWLLARHDLDHIRNYLADRGGSLAAQLAEDAARTIAAGDLQGMQRLVDQTRAASGVVYARVLDQQGLLLAAAGQRPASAARGASAVEKGAPIPVGSEAWEFQAPLGVAVGPASPAVLGTAAVGISLSPLAAMRRGRLTSAVVFVALSALLGVLGAGLLARAMTRPLRALVDATDRISRGDLAARVAVDGPDEVGHLAGSFNAMAESIARSRTVLEEKVRELERANHLKSEFMATMSHELRTPLNVILGHTEMLVEGAGGEVTPAQAEMLAAIERYSRAQLELITRILDFTRLSSGEVSLNVERFALAPLLRDIETHQSVRLNGKGVTLSVTVDAEVDEVETDRAKLHEICNNLVDNAVKFTEAGTISVRASLAEPGWLSIEVADSGRGIPPEDVESIFEAFHQLGESSTRSTGGVGLGLSIVRQLTEALGGSVSVSSMPGDGSVFRVRIPCLPVVPAAVAATSATAALDAASRNTSAVRERSPRMKAGRSPRRASRNSPRKPAAR
jgi:signal transduction histidine kinase